MPKRTHGYGGKEKLYSVWSNMRNRCNNPKCKEWKYYGEKNIKVCDEWDDYIAFRNWAYANGYAEDVGLTIDRVDIGGNYCPGNCRWVTRKVQANNTTRHHYLTIDGVTHNISEWAEITGVPAKTIEARVRAYGWTPEKAVRTPVNSHKRLYDFNGELHSIKEWAQITGINEDTLYNRINSYGWDIAKALTTKARVGGHYQ